jgi:hypothetical protein
MIELILILIANSLYIFGLIASMNEGMILEAIPKQLNWLPDWAKMPLFDCPICMSSAHSYIFPWLLLYLDNGLTLLWLYPIYVVMLAGLNSIILNITND